jgi:hypothetical protein
MTAPLSPSDAAAYLARWREVAALEAELSRADPMALRLRQLAALFEARHLFPADAERERETEALREVWRRLRESGVDG